MEVRIKNLTKKFGDFTAVNELSLTINNGDLVGLLGPSGCGKSTTLFMLAGLLKPTSGQIFFGDEDVTNLPPEKRGIGLVFQNYALYPHMTVEENIMFPMINLKFPKKIAREKAQEAADLVQIGHLMKRKPKELSGGQQQRVAIARALTKEPKILLLDEPLSNLDAKLRLETREEIKRIVKKVGITSIFVTHDQEEALSISDKIAVMSQGVLQQYEEPQTMYKQPINQFVAEFLGTPPINILDATVESSKLTSSGITLRERTDLANNDYTIGIRPEAFRISEEGLSVKVDDVEMIGKDLLVFFYIGEKRIKALIDSDYVIKKDELITVSIKENAVHVFEINDEKKMIKKV